MERKGPYDKGWRKGKGKKNRFTSEAEHIADFMGRRETSVDCPFYTKIGACRHGAMCSRQHNKPALSRTLLLAHVYTESEASFCVSCDNTDYSDLDYSKYVVQIEAFYEEIFHLMAQCGEVEDLILIDNISDHMSGNVYVKFYEEASAARAMTVVNGKWYNGRQVKAEFSPVQDFRDARCRAYTEATCPRGQNCNFMHIRHIPKILKRACVVSMYHDHPEYEQARNEAGKPLIWKNMVKTDWANDTEARNRFSHKWWEMYNLRRDRERDETPPNAKKTAEMSPGTRRAGESKAGDGSFFPASAASEDKDKDKPKNPYRSFSEDVSPVAVAPPLGFAPIGGKGGYWGSPTGAYF